jgi:type IV fimbrial biogenesis protein FimT
MRARSTGFTLIEVILAVTVLALILGFGVPSFVETIRNTRVRALAESVQSGLQKAKAEAIRRNRPVGFWLVTPAVGVPGASCALSGSSGSWVIALDDPAGKCNIAPSATVEPRIVELAGSTSENINVTATAADGSAASSVTFNGFGQPVASPAPITRIDIAHQQTGARQLRVQISSSGGVRMCDVAVTETSDPRRCL